MARRSRIRAVAEPAEQPHAEPPAAGHRPGWRESLPPDWLPIALLFGDAIIVLLSIPAAFYYYETIDPLHHPGGSPLSFAPYVVAMPLVLAFYFFALTVNRQYRSWRGRTLADLLLGLYNGIGLAAVLVLAAISLGNLGLDFSRLTITYMVLLTAILMTGERYLLRQYETRLRRRGVGTERILMVGTGPGSEMLLRRMTMFPQYGFQVCGVLADGMPAGAIFAGSPVVGTIDDLPDAAREMAIDQVFIAMGDEDRRRLLHLVKQCEDQKLEFKLIPDLLDIMSTRAEVNSVDGLPLVGIRHSRLTGTNAVLKRAVDIAASALALIVLSPFLLIVALVIRLTSPGAPVVFRQERIGLNREPFIVFKFRTMIPDAEAKTGPVVALPGDPRTTAFGRVMRKLSIDELPQLWNVLKGDMSLVGPRPQPTFFDTRYSVEVPRYLERQQVRPGLTGWAEVNDLRGGAPIMDRTMYDVYYVENWSLVLDLKIILLTWMRLFFQSHAY
jgi:exopolysaccharide biosynthesis polyprenyl glycosylphosphotransferase